MTNTTTTTGTAGTTAFKGPERAEDFSTGEGLRSLLYRLRAAGPGSWVADPVARELMAFVADKYAPLARKHHLDPWEAASAAFDVMRTRAARTANDPWGVVTHAVRITCIAEERGQGLLCSVHQARRPHISALHDPERLSQRDNPLDDYHPAFFHTAADDPTDDDSNVDAADGTDDGKSSLVYAMMTDATALLTLLGWPNDTARSAVEHVCGTLARCESRAGAFEALRRDRHARALLDIPAVSWTVLLRVLLGNPAPGYHTTTAGRGVLLRLLVGETLPSLLADDALVGEISTAAPRTVAAYTPTSGSVASGGLRGA